MKEFQVLQTLKCYSQYSDQLSKDENAYEKSVFENYLKLMTAGEDVSTLHSDA
jgi:hypothetical protein